MNQDDLMNQLMNQSVAAGTSFDYAAMEKIKEMMDEQSRGARTDTSVRIDAPVLGGLGFPGTSGDVTTVGSALSLGKYVSYPDEFKINKIIAIRNKLDDFLDGSSVLIKVMNPQTIREMVRELRHEIREIKRDHGISELAIIEHLEKELEVETDRRADAQSAIDRYDRDNEVPF